MLILAVSASAQAAIWIEYFDGIPEDYRLERGEQVVPVMIYRELRAGDKLVVLKKKNILRLKCDDGSDCEVSSDKPYCVGEKCDDGSDSEDLSDKFYCEEGKGKTPALLSNLVTWAGSWLNSRLDDHRPRGVVSMVSRGETQPINLPLIPVETARLVAGSRPVHIAWKGGYPPFSLRLVMEDSNKVVLDTKTLNEWRYDSKPITLGVGRYQLEISDRWQQKAIGIEVVPDEALPILPVEVQTGNLEADMQETLYALWLAAQGKEWMLESYQRAVALEKQHLPARLLKSSLEKGDRPNPTSRIQSLN